MMICSSSSRLPPTAVGRRDGFFVSTRSAPAGLVLGKSRLVASVRASIARVVSTLAVSALAASALAFPGAVMADERVAPLQDVFSFSVSREAAIDNDLMRATLVVQDEAKEAAVLAERINTTMRWALDALASYETIRPITRDYRTWPRHDTSQSRRLIGWRASQTLELESEDFQAMAAAIATLQTRLQVQGTGLEITPARRRQASETLIEAALAAFRGRAELIRASFGADGYRVLDVDVQSENGASGVMMRSRALAMDGVEASVAEPGIAAGTTRVVVRVHGRIQLSP